MRNEHHLSQGESQLDQLKQMTTVVADSGDFEIMKAFHPRDATTNPSLILKAIQKKEYEPLLEKAIHETKSAKVKEHSRIEHIIDYLLVLFGVEILKIVPGRVSTEVDAHLSFDVEGSIQKAHDLIRLYEEKGINRASVLIKLASTWEGAQAAKILQKEGINCNMTLLFSFPQAVICAQAGARLISPFVGRIYDWYKKETGHSYLGDEDPGVQSVCKIYNYYKKFGFTTEVMGASFRNKGQILALAGCDLLTISPELLAELKASNEPVERKLSVDHAKSQKLEKVVFDEKTFRYQLNEDAMATEKLAEGIRKFAADIKILEDLILKKL